MGQPSTQASNALIYITYGSFLCDSPIKSLLPVSPEDEKGISELTCRAFRIFGCAIAWRLRHQTKDEFLSSNRTQT
ncbi:hypothetical protein VE04_02788, partial [Pseudogymnoascus sp. 24MN13]